MAWLDQAPCPEAIQVHADVYHRLGVRNTKIFNEQRDAIEEYVHALLRGPISLYSHPMYRHSQLFSDHLDILTWEARRFQARRLGRGWR